MLITILIIAALVVVALVYAGLQPDTFTISRSITVNAPPEKVFSLVNDLRAHRSWSPFDQDAAMKRDYSPGTAGKGASMAFDGGMKTGVGSLTITDASAPSHIAMALTMSKPLRCDNAVRFTFEPESGNAAATRATWTMSGPQPFLAKVMNSLLRCDLMCARQFEQGLAKLKSVAEA